MKLKLDIKLILLSIVYLVSRLIRLDNLPVFADEAIYIRWAQFIYSDFKEYAFMPLFDGKPPLFMWLVSLSLRLIKDPLIAGRVVSLIIGLLTLIFLYETAKNFFNKRVAFFSAIFYLTCPFFFTYNRMALIEGLLAFSLCLQIYFLSLYFKTRKKYFILFSGIAWGMSMLSKTSAFFFFPLYLPISFYFKEKKKIFKKDKFKIKTFFYQLWQSKEVLIYLSGAIFLAVLIFLGTTKHSHFFPALFRRSRDFSFTLEEFIQGQYKSAFDRLWMVTKWIAYYNSPIIFLFFIFSFLTFFKKREKSDNKKIIFLFWVFILLFLIPMTFLGKILAPRYFLPLTSIILITASFIMNNLRRIKWLEYLLIIITLGFNTYFIGVSLWDVNKTPFLQHDKVSYLQEWSSGHGIKEAFLYLKGLSEKEKITVGVEGFFGTLPDGILIYRDAINVPNLEIIALGAYIKSVPDEMMEKAYEHKTFLLGNSHRFVFSEEAPVILVKAYERPAGGPQLLLYEIIAEK